MATAQHEFSTEQEALFSSLGRKMGWVGMFFAIVGVLNLLVSVLIVAAVYRNHFPADWMSQLPPETQSQIQNLPPSNHLWGYALNAGISGLIYLLIGVWTQTAGTAFRSVATTQGRDISFLMQGLSALHQLYSLVYTLLVVAVVFILGFMALSLYLHFAG